MEWLPEIVVVALFLGACLWGLLERKKPPISPSEADLQPYEFKKRQWR